jgi:tetratricopeptide (TPR) repeat protein
VALAQRDWSAAADSAERLTNLVPRDLTGWILRGKVEFSCEHFKDAGDYFQRAAEVARGADVLDEMDAWRYYLVARALDEDLPGYRAACAALIKQCTDRLPPQLILRWATLLPGGVDDLAPLVRLFKKKADADKKAEAERGNPQITVINLSIQAQAHLRTGEYAEVLKTITALEDIPHGLMGNDRLVRAMALYRVGRKAEAKKELEQARTWGRRFVAGSELMPASGRPLPDPMKLVYRIFFREAAEMIPE